MTKLKIRYCIICKDYDVWYKYLSSFPPVTPINEIHENLKKDWNGTLQLRHASGFRLSELEIVFDDRESYMEFIVTWS